MNKLEEALDRYFDFFEEPYPLVITTQKSDEEIIREIDNCIKTKTKAPEPKFDDGKDY